MTIEQFIAVAGFEPSNRIMEYVDCNQYGPLGGHVLCGVCDHGMPRVCACVFCRRGHSSLIRVHLRCLGLSENFSRANPVRFTPTVVEQPSAEDPDRILPFSELGLE